MLLGAARPAPTQATDTTREIAIQVDCAHPIGAISPYIYGMAMPTAAEARELRLPLTRWGGNPASRYNWERGNAWNTARDWHFWNTDYNSRKPEDRQPSGVADRAISNNRARGAETLITIPTIGWVARNSDIHTRSLDVPAQGGPPVAPGSEAIVGYDPTANRQRVSVRSLPRKGRPFADTPDLKDEAVYQDEWVAHLVHKFGGADAGGVKFYAMDNEPDLWQYTHTDMHPTQPDYAELWERFRDYAAAVKDVDPSAQIAGPVSWGWTNYFYSPRDEGSDRYRTHADRQQHGNTPFLLWFLQQARRQQAQSGKRLLAVLDVHYYPQASGVYNGGGATDAATNALRLRQTRALWDPTYTDESWINAPVQLLPRLRRWVAEGYPGTMIALNEWNWGADGTLNGALAIADILGILGREQTYMACYWTAPKPNSPGFFAYRLFRDADGAGHGFGELALPVRAPYPDDVTCYAARERATGSLTLLLINKRPARNARVRISLRGQDAPKTIAGYRYDGNDLKAIRPLTDNPSRMNVSKNTITLTLPAYSLTLLRCL